MGISIKFIKLWKFKILLRLELKSFKSVIKMFFFTKINSQRRVLFLGFYEELLLSLEKWVIKNYIKHPCD